MEYKKIVYALLGLLMLVSGVTKLFVTGHAGVTGMLAGNFLFSWAPSFWAWILIIGETVFGLAIVGSLLMHVKDEYLKYAGWGSAFIMFVVVVTMQIKWANIGDTGWNGLITHLILGFSYLMLAEGYFTKKH